MAELRKILLAEDDFYIRDIYGTVLRAAGYEVTEAADGRETLEKIVSLHPDILMLDIMMPLVDGLEILDKLHNDPSYQALKPRIIVVTNLAQPEIAEEANKYKIDGYLVKANTSPEEVVEMVNTLRKQSQVEGPPPIQPLTD